MPFIYFGVQMSTVVFHSGRIVPGYLPGTQSHHAMAIRDGHIIAFDDEAMALGQAKRIDLGGDVLAPAFADGHAHPTLGGLETVGPDTRSCRSVAEIVASVKSWAQAHPEQEWIRGASYDASLAPGGMFDARWLDEAVPDRPVWLRAWDYHTLWVNSEALRQAGITRDTPEPELGRIVRRSDGSPLGILQEPGACDLIAAVDPGYSRAERVLAIERATAHLAALGIGWAQDAWVEPVDVESYLDAASAERLHMRINLAFRADPRYWRDQLAQFRRQRERVEQLHHPLLTATTVKIFVDGVIENHTGALLEEYSDTPGDHGMANWSSEALSAAAIAFDADSFQLHLHAIGDAASRSALDAIELVQRHNGARDRRPVIAHVQLVDAVDLPRYAQLGVVANFEPLWAQLDELMLQLTVPHIGPGRAELQYPIHTLDQAGPISFGSDWPVSSADWRLGTRVAITRQTSTGEPSDGWTPAERLTAERALHAYTAGVAFQAGAEQNWGTLEIGHAADFVRLSAAPNDVDPTELPSIQVLETWVAGEQRFASAPEAPLPHQPSTN